MAASLDGWAQNAELSDVRHVIGRLNDCKFAPLLAPIAAGAVSQVRTALCAHFRQPVAEGAWRDLMTTLARRLTQAAELAVSEDYDLFRSASPRLAFVAGNQAGAATIYTEAISRGTWAAPLRAAPAVANLLAQMVRHEQTALLRLFARLAQDRPRLGLAASDPVSAIDRAAGDQHDGDAVSILHFESSTWVYKPRPQQPAALYASLAAKLAEQGLSILSPRVVVGEGYGWLEFMSPATDPFSNCHWARSYGELVAVAYAIGLHDLHHENVIFSERGPVVVDAETLLAPVHAFSGDVVSERVSGEIFGDTVLDSGLLPRWEVLPGDRLVDFSPLAAGFPGELGAATWAGLAAQRFCGLSGADREAFTTTINQGFEQAWSVLRTNRSGLLNALSGEAMATRIVIRSTHFYLRVLQASLHPARCGSVGARLDFIREALRPNPNHLDNLRWHFELVECEAEALLAGCIPIFHAQACGYDLYCGDRLIAENFFKRTGVGGVVARFSAIDDPSMAQQRRLLMSAFLLRFQGLNPAEVPAPQIVKGLPPKPFSASLRDIIEELRRREMPDSRGEPTWLSAGLPDAASHLAYTPLDVGLYSGRCGVLCFLTSYLRFQTDPWAERTANALRVALFAHVRNRAAAREFVSLYGVGAGYGAGALLYTLAFSADPQVEADASEGAANLVQALHVSDLAAHPLEFITGLSGLILGLLAAYDRFGDTSALGVARDAGAIMARQIRDVPGLSGPAALQSGMAHGGCGIALALNRLSQRHSDAETLRAMDTLLDALANEASRREAMDPAASTGDNATCHSWCWGLAGTMHLESVFRGRGLKPPTAAAAEAIIRTLVQGGALPFDVDHLCCGAAGLIDALLDCTTPGAEDAAQALAAQMLSGAEARGGFRFFPNSSVSVFNASMFRGLAGIGYTILRLSHRAMLPSVAVMDLNGPDWHRLRARPHGSATGRSGIPILR
ncbi:DUF4135 domain-containing protein [Acuticoccus sp.]|uniref:DUF4135 domain-containing protein n=1 Tax=Acuticoccus sp. TaxID=1904378 RepID=UPI003B5276F8